MFSARKAMQRFIPTSGARRSAHDVMKVKRYPITPAVKAEVEARMAKLKLWTKGTVHGPVDLEFPEHMPVDEVDPKDLAHIDGVPFWVKSKKIIIKPREQKAGQVGSAKAHHWMIVFEQGEKWANPLMGWTSTNDPMTTTRLYFNTRDEAVAWADKNGFEYTAIDQENNLDYSRGRPEKYKHNFLPLRTEKLLKKKGGFKFGKKQFEAPGYGVSNHFMPLTYDGTSETLQHGPPAPKAEGITKPLVTMMHP